MLALEVGEPGTGFPSVFARERDSFFGSADPADTLVADMDAVVVGYASLTHPTPLPENAHVTSIEGFTVVPTWRRRGVGRALLETAVEVARRRGSRKVSLRVLSTNTPARALYETCGFGVEGVLREEFVIDGSPVDDILMARTL